MPERDPYLVLEVSPQASDAEVHAAYRRLVQKHHPDHNQGSPESARRFEEVQEAYARIRQLRKSAPAGDKAPRASAPGADQSPHVSADPNVEAQLADLERELREAHQARERARRAAAEAAAESTKRPSDEELGYVTTNDSFAKILADARSEFSDRLAEGREHPAGRRMADLIDELAAKLKGDGPRDSRK